MSNADLAPLDPIPLAQALMRCPSVTPHDAGAIAVLESALTRVGFACRRMKFGDIENLFATRGAGAPHLLFAGHTDVVPVGDQGKWSVDPFAGVIRADALVGRGAVDMKGAIAAFVCAAQATHPAQARSGRGALSMLITGDEEGPAINGTAKVIDALVAEGEKFDHCLIGEPTSEDHIADTIKIGRRGSVNAVVSVEGVQGHVAYPDKTLNPVPILLDYLDAIRARKLDDGAPGFEPSNLEVTTVDVGNPAHNVVAARAQAKFNVRFNSNHAGAKLAAWFEAERAALQQRHARAHITLETRITGEPFFCEPDAFARMLQKACADVTGRQASLSTSGGTSDGRFIHRHCPVAELGLLNETAHKVDEFAMVEDVRTLAHIYANIITAYFA